jgi:hypothetical protein
LSTCVLISCESSDAVTDGCLADDLKRRIDYARGVPVLTTLKPQKG